MNKKITGKLDVVAHMCHPGTWEAEVGEWGLEASLEHLVRLVSNRQ
jgi:hypothetical protein